MRAHARWLLLAALALLLVAACGTTPTARTTPPASPTVLPTLSPSPSSSATPTTAPTVGPTSTAFPWPAGTPAPAADRVLFGLLVQGTPSAGESFSIYFQAPGAGQSEFELCGGVRACSQNAQQVYLWESPIGVSGTCSWAFQKQVGGGAVQTISSGSLDPAQGGTITGTTTA